MKNLAAKPTFQLEWGKSPACRLLGIALEFCLTAGFGGTNPQGVHLGPGPNKAFHNRAPGGKMAHYWTTPRRESDLTPGASRPFRQGRNRMMRW